MSALSTSPAFLPFPSIKPADVATLYREAVEFYDDNSRPWAQRAGYVLSKFGQARDEANTAKMLADSLAERVRVQADVIRKLQVENMKRHMAVRFALVALGETIDESDAPDVLEGHDAIEVTDCPCVMSQDVLNGIVSAVNSLRAVS